ncbi:serpin-ZX, partial [Trifolium medium]|nr:serpin-ZX [Trifolium medium]
MTITKHVLSKSEYKENNVVISPLSLQIVLSMVAAGPEGPTQRQLLAFFQSKSISHLNSLSSQLVSYVLIDASGIGGPRLTFANAVWVEKSLSLYPSFKQIVASDYMATIASLDFINKADETTETVNLWTEKETNGLIRDILPPGSIDSLTRLIFANALYFKGAWYQPFDASKTKDYEFHLLNGSSDK